MGILGLFRKKTVPKEDHDEKVIDLSDMMQYPASVLADLNDVFSLGDDSQNMLTFLHGKWTEPSFHWGWDDITHEEAVRTDFLQRAFYALNTQHRKRRDAMIDSEGYRFVWKNKQIEPVPGLLTGEDLCKYLTHARESGLDSMKSINAREDKDRQRWTLQPSYEDLMAEMEKDEKDRDFNFRDKGCGMLCFWSKAWGNKQTFMVNTALKKSYPISEPNGYLVGFTKDDIDWDNVSQLEHNADAYRLVADYGGIGIEDYRDGMARVHWMLYPDGRYFGDGDGFGMDDNDEVDVYAYIDTECRVVIKFQDMKDHEKIKTLYQEAKRLLASQSGV